MEFSFEVKMLKKLSSSYFFDKILINEEFSFMCLKSQNMFFFLFCFVFSMNLLNDLKKSEN